MSALHIPTYVYKIQYVLACLQPSFDFTNELVNKHHLPGLPQILYLSIHIVYDVCWLKFNIFIIFLGSKDYTIWVFTLRCYYFQNWKIVFNYHIPGLEELHYIVKTIIWDRVKELSLIIWVFNVTSALVS